MLWKHLSKCSKKAIELGVDRIEMDVRQSKDGVLVLMHDARLERTTNGKGYLQTLPMKSSDVRCWELV